MTPDSIWILILFCMVMGAGIVGMLTANAVTLAAHRRDMKSLPPASALGKWALGLSVFSLVFGVSGKEQSGGHRMIRRAFTFLLYLVLLSVVVSCFHSIWVGLMARGRYQAVFPGAQGTMYWVTQSLSFAAGVNSILIALRKRWAILMNPAIGALSILAIEIVRGPRVNALVVLVACTLSTGIAWWLWGVRSRVLNG